MRLVHTAEPTLAQGSNRLTLEEVMLILIRIQDSPAIECVVRNPEGIPDISNPSGARELIYSGENSLNTTVNVSLHIDENNMLSRMIWEPDSIGSDNASRREAYFLPPTLGRSALPAPPRPAWTGELYTENIARSASTRPRSDRSTPPEAPPAQRLRIATPPQAQAAASPELMPMPRILDMAQMRDFHQNGIHVIKHPGFQQPEFAPAAHDARLTVEDGIRDADGSLHYYLEEQTEQSCAQHAVNAMLGGPFVSFAQFVQHELRNRPANTARSQADILNAIALGGVEPETVLGVLHEQGFATTAYRHVPTVDSNNRPVINWQDLTRIDDLDTDRLLMHTSLAAEDSHTGRLTAIESHFVAFRRDSQTRQWVLLDSVQGFAQTMDPSECLRDLDAESGLLNEVTVIVPRQRLRLAAGTAAGEGQTSGAGASATRETQPTGAAAQDHGAQPAGPSSRAAAPRPEQQATEGARFKVVRTERINNADEGRLYRLTYTVINDQSNSGSGTKSEVRFKTYYVRKFDSDAAANAAMQKDIESINNGTFVPPNERQFGEVIPDYPGLTWFGEGSRVKKNYYEIRIKNEGRLKGLVRTFSVDKHGSQDAARQAAIATWTDIRENPDKYRKRQKVQYQSIIRGVFWRLNDNEWVFKVSRAGGNDGRRKFKGGNPEDAQLEAERFALESGARPVIRPPSQFAPNLTNVPSITWDHQQRAFLVGHGDELRLFNPADYNNNLLAARTAAENHAREMAQATQEGPFIRWGPTEK